MTLLSSFINMDSPLSLYSIPVVYFTSFYPSMLKVRIFSLITKERISCCHQFLAIDKAIGYNKCVELSCQKYRRNANICLSVQPRSNTSKLANNKQISPELAARIQRMEGAHLNGNEAFPLWVAAIVSISLRASKRPRYLINYKPK